MSTLSLSPQPPPPSTLQSGTSVEDPAASLRAAALRTLKAKRRKGTESTDIPAMPPRPPTSQSTIQLDYGTEESLATTTSTLTPITTPAPALASAVSVPTTPTAPTAEVSAPTPVLDHVPMDVDEDQTREEGEISDSESAPPSAPAPKTPPVLNQVPPSTQPSKPSPPRVGSSPKLSPSSRPSVSIKLEPTLIVEPSPSSSGPSGLSSGFPSSVDSEMYYVDDEHVRPGLRMTQAQYDTAKDVILDLLGWGVPPDYLLQIGLSREIVYYVFVELNLQLPAGLDVSGLPPVSSWAGHTYSSPEPMSPVTQRTPKPRSAQAARRSTASSWPHPSLPRKPDAPQGTHPNGTPISVSEPRPSAGMSEPSPAGALDTSQSRQPVYPPRSSTTTETAPAFVDALPVQQPLSLHDIEQQRRQELLARKAVLASRKKQQATVASPIVQPAIPPPRKVSNPPPIHKQTVDDFLNSIGPVGGDVKPAVSSTLGDEMDVDDQIPGLSASSSIFPPSLPPPEIPPPSEAPTSPSESISPSSIAFPPPSEVSSQSTRSSSTEIDQNILVSTGRSGSSESSDRSTPRLQPRRTAKRPVAADFVDMESDSTRSYHSHHHPYHRRKPFAGLKGPRRMIIDVSDSEEDVEHHGIGPINRAPRPQPATPNGVVIPEVLFEKEQEIKMLREKIAQREQEISGRKAAGSTRAIPSGTNTPQLLQTSVVVKEEEDDTKASASLHITPPGFEPNGAAFAPLPSSESSSGRATPIDVASNVLEHPVTGDQVLTSEAWQEQVARMPSPVNHVTQSASPTTPVMEVDAVGSSQGTSSAQAAPSPDQDGFAPYHSLLDSYPLLCANSPSWFTDASVDLAGLFIASEGSRTSDPSVLSPVNLSLLKAAAVNKFLSDPSRCVCQYEVPGGGECRDSECEDIHPSQAGAAEPSDEETSLHLHAALPHGSQVTVMQIQSALQDHRREAGMDYHTRVKEALASLGLRMAEG